MAGTFDAVAADGAPAGRRWLLSALPVGRPDARALASRAGSTRNSRRPTTTQAASRRSRNTSPASVSLRRQLAGRDPTRGRAAIGSPFNRYVAGSRSDPDEWTTNWNMTFVLEPRGAPTGGVLLLHGLTDSPYSLRSLAEVLAGDGRRVVGLRLPGHGTAPSGLLQFELEDLAGRHDARDARPAPDARPRPADRRDRLFERGGARGRVTRSTRATTRPCRGVAAGADLARDRHHSPRRARAHPHRASPNCRVSGVRRGSWSSRRSTRSSTSRSPGTRPA